MLSAKEILEVRKGIFEERLGTEMRNKVNIHYQINLSINMITVALCYKFRWLFLRISLLLHSLLVKVFYEYHGESALNQL